MEFTDALKIIQTKKECLCKFCDSDCSECKDSIKPSDMIEAYQMAIFALKQLIESEGE